MGFIGQKSRKIWLSASEFGHLENESFKRVNSRSETKRQLTSWEDEELLIQLLSIKKADVEMIVQAGRKFLQKVRQWQGAHPAESRLARCVIRHCIDSKIPGIVATAYDEEVDDDGETRCLFPCHLITKQLSVPEFSTIQFTSHE